MFELTWLHPTQHCQLHLAPGTYVIAQGKVEVGPIPTGATERRIAIDDPDLGSSELRLNLSDTGSAQVENLGRPVLLPTGRRIHRGQSQMLESPSEWVVGKTRYSLTYSDRVWPYDSTLTTLEELPLGEETGAGEKGLQTAPAAGTLVHWFDALNRLHASTVGSRPFHEQAVQCLFDPGGLDLGMLLEPADNQWRIVASHVPFPEAGFAYRRDLVNHVAASGQLWYHSGDDHFQPGEQAAADWVVAAPIWDMNHQIAAVLYGARFENPYNQRHGIRPLEAHFVRLLADAISTANRRLQAEAETARVQVLLEQTFSRPVVKLLQRDPQLLASRQSDVTVLFADLRGFTSTSETLGAALTHQLLADLLNRWTRTVQDQQGVVIDYYGDGLAAFWNCPVAVADHPWLACQTAWQLLDDLEEVNQHWSDRLSEPLRAGVGIHTGPAQVGNSGSQEKLKYGPRGPTVNLASRLESATKRFGVSILLSQDVARQVADRCLTLRLCQTLLPGMQQPVTVHQLLQRQPNAACVQLARLYTQALEAFEHGQWEDCLQELIAMMHQSNDDRRLGYLLEQLELRAGQRLSLPERLADKRPKAKSPVSEQIPEYQAQLAAIGAQP